MPKRELAPCSPATKARGVFAYVELAAVGLAVCGMSPLAAAITKQTPVADLQRHSQKFERLAQDHEFRGLGALYAPDAWRKPACSPLVQGKSQLVEAWKELFARKQFNPSFRIRDFDVSPDGKFAVERGRAHFLENVGGVPYGSNFEYTRIWKKVGRRSWQIAADIALAADTCDDDDE